MKKWLKHLNSTPFGMKPTEAKEWLPSNRRKRWFRKTREVGYVEALLERPRLRKRHANKPPALQAIRILPGSGTAVCDRVIDRKLLFTALSRTPFVAKAFELAKKFD